MTHLLVLKKGLVKKLVILKVKFEGFSTRMSKLSIIMSWVNF